MRWVQERYVRYITSQFLLRRIIDYSMILLQGQPVAVSYVDSLLMVMWLNTTLSSHRRSCADLHLSPKSDPLREKSIRSLCTCLLDLWRSRRLEWRHCPWYVSANTSFLDEPKNSFIYWTSSRRQIKSHSDVTYPPDILLPCFYYVIRIPGACDWSWWSAMADSRSMEMHVLNDPVGNPLFTLACLFKRKVNCVILPRRVVVNILLTAVIAVTVELFT